MTPDEKFMAQVARESMVREVNDELRLFKKTDNGLHLWRAYRLCRDAGEPIPEVILQYLDRIEERLRDADSPGQIAAALSMAPRYGSARKRAAPEHSSFHIASQMHLLMTLPGGGMSKNEAARILAKRMGVTPPSIERRYERWISKASPDDENTLFNVWR